MKNLLERAKNSALSNRDHLIDEVNDRIQHGTMTPQEQEVIAAELLNMVRHEKNPAVCESAYNALKTIFDNSVAQDMIAAGIAPQLDSLSVGCLVHAIPMVAGSSHQDKVSLLAPFKHSENPAVKEAMADAAEFLRA